MGGYSDVTTVPIIVLPVIVIQGFELVFVDMDPIS